MAVITCPKCGELTTRGLPCGECGQAPEVPTEEKQPQVAYRVLVNGKVHHTFVGIHELFSFDPETAAFFALRPCATYYEYNQKEDIWRWERVG